MKPRHKRLVIATGVVAVVGVAAALVLNAFQSNLVFFYSPSQIASSEAPTAAPSDWADWSKPAASSAMGWLSAL